MQIAQPATYCAVPVAAWPKPTARTTLAIRDASLLAQPFDRISIHVWAALFAANQKKASYRAFAEGGPFCARPKTIAPSSFLLPTNPGAALTERAGSLGFNTLTSNPSASGVDVGRQQSIQIRPTIGSKPASGK